MKEKKKLDKIKSKIINKIGTNKNNLRKYLNYGYKVYFFS